ncbi:MAG: hypothetical protein AUK47_26505 [Deltaproteobacteria bacterium CG2_30_63_29]|nr:MAG: hypothetical protein AUK47_26505 [Deltaproteobacteria bacterium CG2_30_63_29]PJB41580.1 MAG: potassium transporter [Deltaproteobacteria bacterium CG_4_9_14_3_um_filter_63_12]
MVESIAYLGLSPKRISRLLGVLMIVLAACMASSIVIGAIYHDAKSILAFAAAVTLTFLVGGAFFLFGRDAVGAISRRDAIVVVSFSWVFIGVFGGLPYIFDGTFTQFHDAFFETISGFSTTGATVITNIEGSLSKAGHWWRCLTHWLGGMGIIVLFVAIFPQLGVGGKFLFKSEVPGPIVEGLKPKIKETSKALWLIYFFLTLVNFALLWLVSGMNWFDAICHAFGTLATGGFSTKNASIAYYNEFVSVDIITTLFMFLAGANFALYYVAIVQGGVKRALADRELWAYAGVVFVATIAVTIWLNINASPTDEHNYGNIFTALRYASFQVVSIITTTGFGTANFDMWAPAAKLLLFFAMFMGGCAGSTAGGIKVFRVLVVVKACFNEIHRAFRPESVRMLRVGTAIIRQEVVHTIVVFFALFVLIFVAVTLFVASFGHDFITSASSTIACLASIGPGLEKVNAVSNFAFYNGPIKIVLSFCMILGRLELFTVLVLFVPSFWRR